MAPLFIKLLVCPTILLLFDVISTEVEYRAMYQVILMGLLLAFAGHLLDQIILKRKTVWLSTITDFIAAAVILYMSPLLFPGSRVTFWGALMTAFVLGAAEYLQHVVLVQRSGRRRRLR